MYNGEAVGRGRNEVNETKNVSRGEGVPVGARGPARPGEVAVAPLPAAAAASAGGRFGRFTPAGRQGRALGRLGAVWASVTSAPGCGEGAGGCRDERGREESGAARKVSHCGGRRPASLRVFGPPACSLGACKGTGGSAVTCAAFLLKFSPQTLRERVSLLANWRFRAL